MKKINLLVLTGEKFSGKDTLARGIIREFGFRRISFSDQLKTIANTVFPWLNLDYPSELKEVPLNIDGITLSPRQIWERMDFLREIDPHIYANRVKGILGAIAEFYDPSDENAIRNLVITDLRTKEEYEMLVKLEREQSEIFNVFIVRVISFPLEEDQRSHVEKDIENFVVDYDFFNGKKVEYINKFVSGIAELFGLSDSKERWFIPLENWEQMLDIQEDLNVKFSGNNWKHSIPSSKFKKAFAVEYAEFLDELKPEWKWWKDTSFGRSEDVKLELADVIHFGLSLVILGSDKPYDPNDEYTQSIDDAFSTFLVNSNLRNLDTLVRFACEMIDVSSDEIRSVFMKKNEINKVRIATGYCSGTVCDSNSGSIYDKSI
jgi:dimeric dUTPase (all-alpha-NTP-PPase superfamily)